MSYQVLARKWRPQNFSEMVGQQHVLQALSNALDEERLHHAYLFTGTRGVGKTTIARILVKCLNCETGVTSKPCGECSSCQEIAEGRFVDLIEVDAASRTKVEDTREMLENVHYAPTRGRFKVYLIDEVHMLSTHSFNALLKTLEEPPPHVKFLFATTDPQKLPVTILSRCLQFNLKRMPVDLITRHLKHILEAEKIAFDEASLRWLARGADGSMRDALSLMDQAIGYGGGTLEETEVREMLGTISHDWLARLIHAARQGDGQALMKTVEEMAGQVPDFEGAADSLISLLHQVAVRQAVPSQEMEDEIVQQLAEKMTPEDVQLYYQIALHARRDLPLSPEPRAGFEMMLLRMMTFRPLDQEVPVDEAVNTSQGGQAAPKKKRSHLYPEVVVTTATATTEAGQATVDPVRQEAKAATPRKEPALRDVSIDTVKDDVRDHKTAEWDWHEIVASLQLKGMPAQLANHCLLHKFEAGTVYLTLDQEGEQLNSNSAEEALRIALEGVFAQPVKLKITTAEVQVETPEKRQARQANEQQQAAERHIAADPFVQALQAELDAQIIPGSIKARQSQPE